MNTRHALRDSLRDQANFKYARGVLFSLPVLVAMSATGVHEPVEYLRDQIDAFCFMTF